MIWLVKDFDFLSILLRAAALAGEALLLGGIAYLWLVAFPIGKMRGTAALEGVSRRGIRLAAILMATSELAAVAVSSASLMNGSGLRFRDFFTANFFVAGVGGALASLLLWLCARGRTKASAYAMLPAGLLLLATMVLTSHAASRLDDRLQLVAYTAVHHLGTAFWLGAMPFLFASLNSAADVEEARIAVSRFSWMAIGGAVSLTLAGVALSYFYLGSWSGFYATGYGQVLAAKIALLLAMLALGAGNYFLGKKIAADPQPLLLRLRRFTEAELGIGFTIVLAAASLTSQTPGIDVQQDRLTLPEIYQRMHPVIPRMTSPPAARLTPATSMNVAIQVSEFSGPAPSDANDRAWSEYNHHWAGLIVLAAGALAVLSRVRGMRWARFWPLTFAGLAVFIVLRADPENWPIGPRSFWESFSAPDVMEHRAAALLILGFAAFECSVQAGILRRRWATLAFPAIMAVGAALLLLHTHGGADAKEEILARLSHMPVALLGAVAAWSRWLELRLPPSRAARAAGWLWPVCLAAAGMVLLNYRES
jgi:putative copper resistance protein D